MLMNGSGADSVSAVESRVHQKGISCLRVKSSGS